MSYNVKKLGTQGSVFRPIYFRGLILGPVALYAVGYARSGPGSILGIFRYVADPGGGAPAPERSPPPS